MWNKNVGELTQVVGELTVGEMTRWRNDRNSLQQTRSFLEMRREKIDNEFINCTGLNLGVSLIDV